MLKSLLIQLSAATARQRIKLETKLRGVNGYTGRGEIEYLSWNNTIKRMGVELRGIAGQWAEIFVDGNLVQTVPLMNGKIAYTFDTQHGDTVPSLQCGDNVEIRQNGHPILKGVLSTS